MDIKPVAGTPQRRMRHRFDRVGANCHAPDRTFWSVRPEGTKPDKSANSGAIVTAVAEEALGNWLRQWRQTNRWTQERLAEALGYEVSYVAKIERGRRRPTQQFVARLADVASMPRQELLQLCRRPTARVRLPVPTDAVVGRSRVITEVSGLLERTRCVTLVGPPGVGKTTVALEVAWRTAKEYRDGTCFVPLAEVCDLPSVAAAIVQHLGLAEQGGRSPEELITEALRHRRMLLVLDNFEHVLVAKSLVASILIQAPRVRVLVTSREALGVEGEEEYPMQPLEFPDPAGDLQRAADYPAVQVFIARAQLVRPDFALTEVNVRPVVEICSRLDGLPLAISLTAAATRLLSPVDIARGLAPCLERAEEGASSALLDRRLIASLDWSWDLLASSQQTLLARLGVFAGGYSLAAVQRVCAEDWEGASLLDDLAALEGKSLIQSTQTDSGVSRFSSLETVSRYATGRLRASGRLEELRRRHCSFYTDLVEEVEPHITGGRDQAQWLRVLEEDHANVAVAFEWASRREATSALRIAGALWRYFSMRRVFEGRRWLKVAIEAAPGRTYPYLKALIGSCVLARSQGDLDPAERGLNEAKELATEIGAQSELALAVLNLGIVAEQRGRYDVAERYFLEATRLYREIGEERGVGHGLNCLGVIALRRNDNESASDRFLEALGRFRALDDRWSVAVTTTNLGWIAEMENELADARDWYDESRQIRGGIGDDYALAKSTADLGRIARRRKEPVIAAKLLKQALFVFQRMGDRRLAAACLAELGGVAAQQRRREMAARLLGSAESVRDSLGMPTWPDEQRLHDEVLESIRASTDDPSVRKALRTGRALSLEDAVELVASETWPPAYRRWTASYATVPLSAAGPP